MYLYYLVGILKVFLKESVKNHFYKLNSLSTYTYVFVKIEYSTQQRNEKEGGVWHISKRKCKIECNVTCNINEK